MPAPPEARRRWRLEVLAVVVVAACGAVAAALARGGTVLGAIALALFCLAGIGGALVVFYEIGRGEDYDRAVDERRQGASRSTRHSSRSRR